MAKLKRGELKQIVKECLVEILAEGLENSQSSLVESRAVRAPARSRSVKPKRTRENPNFDNAVTRNVSALTDDPMMACLLYTSDAADE